MEKIINTQQDSLSKIVQESLGSLSVVPKTLNEVSSSIPTITNALINLKKGQYEFSLMQLTETLRVFGIHTDHFLNYLAENPNLDFNLTEFEQLKKCAAFELISSIQNSNEFTDDEKNLRLLEVWSLLSEADEKKREQDLKAMLRSSRAKVNAISALLAIGSVCLSLLTLVSKFDPNSGIKERETTKRVKIKADAKASKKKY